MKVLGLILFISLPVSLIAQANQIAQSSTTAFNHVTIIDVMGGTAKSDMTVIITGNQISTIGKTGKVRVPKNAQVIDASGKFLIPGLWDMHAHTLSNNSYEWIFPMLIAHGVTGVREIGNNMPFEQINLFRREILEGSRLGPRHAATTGRILDGPQTTIPHVAAVMTTPDEARQLVRTYKQQGADFIKPYNLLSREVYLAIIDEAKRQKIPVAGHVPFSMSAAEVSELGQVSLEHVQIGIFVSCSRDEANLKREWQELIKSGQRGAGLMIMAKAVATYDEQKAQSFFALLRRNGTSVCPTSIVSRPVELIGDESTLLSDSRMKYVPETSRRRWREAFQQRTNIVVTPAERKARSDLRLKIVAAMQRAGVSLLAGSDAPNPYTFPGFSLHEELELFVEAGLTPLEALRTATLNPAKFFGKEKELGTIEKGKLADLVLLEANPLANINNTRKINAVVLNGRFLDRAALDKVLADAEAAASKEITVLIAEPMPGVGLLERVSYERSKCSARVQPPPAKSKL